MKRGIGHQVADFSPKSCVPEKTVLGVLNNDWYALGSGPPNNISSESVQNVCLSDSFFVRPSEMWQSIRMVIAPEGPWALVMFTVTFMVKSDGSRSRS